MEDLSNTEMLIISYIKSHPPEECMLDKITKGTSRSRATVLKYLDILHAKGILEYKFVGRSKLWSMAGEGYEKTELKPAQIQGANQKSTTDDLASQASRLHSLISQEINIKKTIDLPDTIVFTINSLMDIVATNDTFQTYFKANNLRDILSANQLVLLEHELKAVITKHTITMEMDLIEKQGIKRPYEISLKSIFDENDNSIGFTFVGRELSHIKRTKRDLETLLAIARAAGSMENEEELMAELNNRVNELVPSKYFVVVLKDAGKLNLIYSSLNLDSKDFKNISSALERFTQKSMDKLETISSQEGDLYLEGIKSELKDSDLWMMISVPIIDEDNATGSIILLTTSKSVSSVNIESVEMAADELSSFLKMQRLREEKQEYINTLMAMNRVSEIINSLNNENEDEMLEKSVSAVIESLGFEMGCIYLTDENQELALRVHRNLPDKLRKMCMDGMFKDLFSKTLEKQKLVYITSESEEYDSLDEPVKADGVKTMIILPIKYGEKIIGLLNMGSHTLKPYNKTSRDNLSSIGLQLGLALERSRLAIQLEK